MAEATRLDEDNIGVILSNEEASILYRVLGMNVAASISKQIDIWDQMTKIGVKPCKEEFYSIVTRR